MYCKKTIGIILTALLIAAQSVTFAGKPDLVTLTWNDDPQTTQAVSWRTDANTLIGFIQYYESSDFFSSAIATNQVPVPYNQLATNAGQFNIYSGKLSALRPNTKYYYRVGDGQDWSALSSFTTAPGSIAPFKFLLFGDSQSVDYGIWGKTVQNAYRTYHDAAFFINVGDLIDVGDDYKQWFAWLKNAQGVINNISCMPASGNHENYSITAKLSLPTGFHNLLALPQNGPDKLKGITYSFDYSNAHFIVLDTQYGEEANLVPNLLPLQAAWLERDLAASDKTWKIVVMHRPLYNNTRAESHPQLRTAFAALFSKYHVDVVFNGHDHVYARTFPLLDGKATDNARGTVYVNCGRSGSKKHPLGMVATSLDDSYYNPVDQPNYVEVEITDTRFALKALKQDGAVIDTCVIQKPWR
ncbi:MAG: metallophosphoesterase family protein [Bacillota bacterium]